MTDFTKHDDILAALKQSQEADLDNRDAGREAHDFIDKRDGQWESKWWNANKNKPRYTFDMTGPMVDQVAGEMELAEFTSKVKPAGGDATKDIAQLFDGMIRNIENISNAKDVYSLAARNMVTAGIDGWQIKHKFVDDDSFDQDLVIEPIANFIDSVWFGHFTKPDASDAQWAVVLEAFTKEDYDEKWPDGSGQSVDESRLSDAYTHKHDMVVVGQIYYVEKKSRQLFLMSDGRVLEDTEENKSILDELAAEGITIQRTRKRDKHIVKTRLFDGGGWLAPAKTTVFNQIPVIPCIANFKITENKLIYRGVVEKLLDPQRVFNYAKSREIEEGALAPRAKYWGTSKQVSGHEDTIATLNTNPDPFQIYNPDPEAPNPPQQQGGAQINPGLVSLSQNMNDLIRQSAGLFDASLGDSPNQQSGVAIKRLQNKGDIGRVKYFKALERAICRTARILVDAIPVVYDTPRQVRILKEDGSFDMDVVNQSVFDQQSQKWVKINDVSQGKYDVTCSSGPSFQNRQEETVEAMIETAQVDPSIIQIGADILLNNIPSPGMEQIAQRKRDQLFDGGLIPVSQWSDEEKRKMLISIGAIPPETEDEQLVAFIQQAQQPQPDPAMIVAEAQVGVAQAEQGKAQAQADKVMVDAQIAQSKEERENFKAEQAAQQQQFDQFMEIQQSNTQQITDLAASVKALREGLGIDSIVGPGGLASIIQQVQLVLAAQEAAAEQQMQQ